MLIPDQMLQNSQPWPHALREWSRAAAAAVAAAAGQIVLVAGQSRSQRGGCVQLLINSTGRGGDAAVLFLGLRCLLATYNLAIQGVCCAHHAHSAVAQQLALPRSKQIDVRGSIRFDKYWCKSG